MARRARRAPAARGVACSKCGADLWYSREPSLFRCSTCLRASADPLRVMLNDARSRAERAGVPFTITIDDLRAAYPVDSRCPALGIPLVRGVGFPTDSSPSLDRIRPELGYVPGNIAIISKLANSVKQNAAPSQLRSVAAWLEGVR